MKRKTKLHRDTLRNLSNAELRISGGQEGDSEGCPLKSGRLTCGGETVDTCDTYSKACFGRTKTCTDGHYTC